MRPLVAILLAAPLVVAGCVDAPEEIAAAAEDTLAQATDLITTEYAFDGEISLGASVCAPVMCIWQGLPGSSGEKLDLDGLLSATNLTMTWEATNPTAETMYFGIWWGTQDSEGESEYVSGTSPLLLELADLEIPEGDEVWVWAWPASSAPMGIAQVTTPQPFRVEGTLTTTAPPAPATTP